MCVYTPSSISCVTRAVSITAHMFVSYGACLYAVRLNWNMRLVSVVHAVVIVILSFPLVFDPVLEADHIFGVTPAAINVIQIATGYTAPLHMLYRDHSPAACVSCILCLL